MNDQLTLGLTWPAPDRSLPQLPEGRTLAAAREEMLSVVDAGEGIACPCCEQWTQRYRRVLNSEMARALCIFVRRSVGSPGRWVDIRTVEVRGGEYAKLRHWGLIEQAANDDPSKRRSGWWRPTELGIDFAHGRVRVPSHCYLYAGRCVGFETGTTTIRAALGTRFDYSELMGWAA